MKKYTYIILFALFFYVNTNAQLGPPHQYGQENGRIEQLARVKLIEILKLDEQDMLRFFNRRTTYLDKQRELALKRDEILDRLTVKVKKNEEDKKNEIALKGDLDQIFQLEKQIIDERATYMNSLKDILSEVQLANYILFEIKFKRELR
ncbi:MAG: hypothetical protein K9I69_03630, partial [Ignavibacteriales bacterium]|nr:hypothetical protein [Ignavibacteriales bacterium]